MPCPHPSLLTCSHCSLPPLPDPIPKWQRFGTLCPLSFAPHLPPHFAASRLPAWQAQYLIKWQRFEADPAEDSWQRPDEMGNVGWLAVVALMSGCLHTCLRASLAAWLQAGRSPLLVGSMRASLRLC